MIVNSILIILLCETYSYKDEIDFHICKFWFSHSLTGRILSLSTPAWVGEDSENAFS